jgi:dTDP-4-dehydrorhamnose 3,5-epimerase
MENKIISKIEGVKILKKNILKDDRGKILHMLRADDENFTKFGEVYFSSVNPKKIKAWHIHELMTLNYVAVLGEIKLVLFDDRQKSSTKGVVQEIIISNENHCLISIPPFIWNGFCSNNNQEAVLANCSDIPHDKLEIKRIPFDDKRVPYKWKI